MKKLLASLLLACCCLCAALPVSAEPPYLVDGDPQPVLRDVITENNGDVYRISKVYDAPPGYPPESLVEADFEKQGIRYQAGDVIQVRENHREETKLAAQTMSLSHERKEGAVLAPILDYSMDGFTGQLQLDRNSIVTAPTGQKGYSYTVTDTREISGLARNDTYAVPKTASKNGVALKLADVSWTNLGTSYTATAVYTGTGYGSKTTGYSTTAVYTGEVHRDTLDSVTWKVIYEGTPIPEPETGPNPYIVSLSILILLLLIADLIYNITRGRKPKTLKIVQEDL